MIEFRNACGSDDLMGLWQRCFPDRTAWGELFLRDMYVPEHTFVAVREGRPAGAVYGTPSAFEVRREAVPVTYLLGLGVDPEFREQGIAAALVRKLCESTAAAGVPFVLVTPCSERMLKYYQRLGFTVSTWLAKDPFTREQLTATEEQPQPLPPDAAFKANGVYEEVLRHRDHLHRSAAAWRFAALTAEAAGGGMLALTRDGEFCGYAVYERRPEGVLVREVFAEDEPASWTRQAWMQP